MLSILLGNVIGGSSCASLGIRIQDIIVEGSRWALRSLLGCEAFLPSLLLFQPNHHKKQAQTYEIQQGNAVSLRLQYHT